MDLVKVLCSGSKGNSTIIKYNGHTYIIDLGISYKMFSELAKDFVDFEKLSLFITHTHTDHVKGVKRFLKKHPCNIYGSKNIYELENEVVEISNVTQVNDIRVETLNLSHDCSNTVGYIFYVGEYKIVIVSDTGYLSNKNLESMSGADVILLESNHDVDLLMQGNYNWNLKQRIVGDKGHLSNLQFKTYVNAIKSENTKHLVALHLSADNNKFDIVSDILKGTEIDNCDIARQDIGSKVIKLNWK
ncbi:MAG: MBL fold metallo-hydrolase [Bacilli bacterium]